MSASTHLHNAVAAITMHHHGDKDCRPYACLIVKDAHGSEVTIFGPASGMEAFTRAAAIIHEAIKPEFEQREAAE